MKRLIYLFTVTFFISGCANNSDPGLKALTDEEITTEKQAITEQITSLLNAYELRDPALSIEILSSEELLCFGTDAAEVIRTKDQWNDQITNDLQLIESMKFGTLQNLTINVSETGDLAASLFEVRAELESFGESSNSLIRFSNTWKKEDDSWKAVGMMVAFATEGQSSAEILEQLSAEEN